VCITDLISKFPLIQNLYFFQRKFRFCRLQPSPRGRRHFRTADVIFFKFYFIVILQLLIHCVVRMESESSRFTDELNAYRTYVDRKRLKNGTVGRQELMSSGCGKIHRDREDYAEEGGRYISQGRRVERKPGSRVDVLYEVSFKVCQ
jgi:hypothetical protein